MHRFTCHRTNHDNFRIRGEKEEGTTTPSDMMVLAEIGTPRRRQCPIKDAIAGGCSQR
ncbi:hypothetical protein [Rhizobium setariae]|uniref:phosphoketolase family protein n=1 Tax=Rhizobium setariae TaxID=2801340 RepID=UPI0031BAD129